MSQDGRERYTLHSYLLDVETPDTVSPYDKVRAFVGTDFHFDLLKAISWDNNLLVADRYRDRRVLLAGDACHQYIPTGGYGMNTGVGDALDLGWKLSAVIQGWGGEGLLNSIEEERRPVALRNCEASKRHADVRIAIGKIWPEDIALANAGANERRADLSKKIAAIGNAENESRGIEIGYNYTGSRIVWNMPGDETQDDPLYYTPTTTPGYRPPAVYLSDGTPLFNLFGAGFTLPQFAPDGLDASAFETEARKLGLPFQLLAIRDGHVKSLYAYNLVLLRPDQHVAWRSQSMPENADEILRVIAGFGSKVAERNIND